MAELIRVGEGELCVVTPVGDMDEHTRPATPEDLAAAIKAMSSPARTLLLIDVVDGELNHLDQLCSVFTCDNPRNDSGYCADHEPPADPAPKAEHGEGEPGASLIQDSDSINEVEMSPGARVWVAVTDDGPRLVAENSVGAVCFVREASPKAEQAAVERCPTCNKLDNAWCKDPFHTELSARHLADSATLPGRDYITRAELVSLLRSFGAAQAADHCAQGTFGPVRTA